MTARVFAYNHSAMAFTRVDQWSLAERAPLRTDSRKTISSILDVIFHAVSGSRTRILMSSLATIAVHAALLLFLLFKLSDVSPNIAKPGSGPLTLIDLSQSDTKTSELQKPETQATEQEAQPPAEPEQDQLTASVVPEWTVVKIRVAHILQSIAAAPAKIAASQPSSNAGAGASAGGDGFDPYAGSAPQWKNALPPLPVVKPAALPPTRLVQLEPEMITRLRKAIAKSGAPVIGTFRLHIDLDQDGRVSQVSFVNLSAGQTAQSAIAELLQGKRLACLINASECSSKRKYETAVEALI